MLQTLIISISKKFIPKSNVGTGMQNKTYSYDLANRKNIWQF
jgi:hypothetical protein